MKRGELTEKSRVARETARAAGEMLYHAGIPCRNGHRDPPRFTRDGRCAYCKRRFAKRRNYPPDMSPEELAAWREERRLANARRWASPEYRARKTAVNRAWRVSLAVASAALDVRIEEMKKVQAGQAVELTVEQAHRVADEEDDAFLEELSGGDLDKAVTILQAAAGIIKAEAVRISGLSDEELTLLDEDEESDEGEGGGEQRPDLPTEPEEPEPAGPILGEIGPKQCHRFTGSGEVPSLFAHVCGEPVEDGKGIGQSYCPACLERLREPLPARSGRGFVLRSLSSALAG